MKKEDILKIIAETRKADIDLGETPLLFKWIYVEEPTIEMALMISKKEEVDPMTLN